MRASPAGQWVRHSLNFCAWKDRKYVAADLRRIYGAATVDQAADELDAFEEKWAGKYASIAPAWRRAWDEVTPFFAFDPAIRKIIYTTNAPLGECMHSPAGQ
jgi:putative transposase